MIAVVAVTLLAAILAFVLIDRRSERREWAAERAQLLDRIESPGTVVVQRAQEQAEAIIPEIPYEHPWSEPPIEVS